MQQILLFIGVYSKSTFNNVLFESTIIFDRCHCFYWRHFLIVFQLMQTLNVPLNQIEMSNALLVFGTRSKLNSYLLFRQFQINQVFVYLSYTVINKIEIRLNFLFCYCWKMKKIHTKTKSQFKRCFLIVHLFRFKLIFARSSSSFVKQ